MTDETFMPVEAVQANGYPSLSQSAVNLMLWYHQFAKSRGKKFFRIHHLEAVK